MGMPSFKELREALGSRTARMVYLKAILLAIEIAAFARLTKVEVPGIDQRIWGYTLMGFFVLLVFLPDGELVRRILRRARPN